MSVAVDFDVLEKRVGRLHLRQRMGIEVDHVTDKFGQGRNLFHIENMPWIFTVLRVGLKCIGQYKRGQRNTRDIQVKTNEVSVDDLPPAFDGYTLLHMSDLHLDINTAITDAVIRAIEGLSYDICVLTGDYRAMTTGSYDLAVDETRRLCEAVRTPIYAVLGNHDFIEMAMDLEDMGAHMLLNESVALERGGHSIYLVGIDDPHFYLVDNIEKAADGLHPDTPWILLSHSPETYKKAAYCGFDLMLCGHTHGGQICLPGGFAPLGNARCPRRMLAGAWKYKDLWGYTSRGTGSSGLDVRFNCPPEVTLHTLRKA